MNKSVRVCVALGSIVIYALCIAPLYSATGSVAGALAILPAATVGGLLGVRAGLLFGLLSAPLNWWLYSRMGYPLTSEPATIVLGSLGCTGVAVVTGWMKGQVDQSRQQARRLQEQIAKRQQAEEQLTHNTLHDPLTNLPNRVLFHHRLEGTLERAHQRQDYRFAVVYLDLDRFKIINDSLGHPIGDQLLIASAHRLVGCLRTGDMVARLGGDEFAVLLDEVQEADGATRVADRLQAVLSEPYDLSGYRVSVAASMGIVLGAAGYRRSEDILRDADIAMYRAKARGGGHYAIFDLTMREHAVARLELETDLKQAVERGEFRIYYQPALGLAENHIAGFEALLRWQHPTRGLLRPAEFLPVAEETGLIVPVNWWVLREACRQMREWQTRFGTHPPLTISVNLSPKQLIQPGFIQQVEHILQETELDAHSLMLELTEKMVIEGTALVASLLEQLHALGVRIQIDDFGTGYSSLVYLQSLPADTLKIDPSFVGQIGKSRDAAELVRVMVALGHALGMRVVAEGVETTGQLALLKELQCEYGQGYLFAEPVDSQAADALIEALSATSATSRQYAPLIVEAHPTASG